MLAEKKLEIRKYALISLIDRARLKSKPRPDPAPAEIRGGFRLQPGKSGGLLVERSELNFSRAAAGVWGHSPQQGPGATPRRGG